MVIYSFFTSIASLDPQKTQWIKKDRRAPFPSGRVETQSHIFCPQAQCRVVLFCSVSPPYCSHVPSAMPGNRESLCLLCSTHSHMQNALPSRGKERSIIDIVHICQCVETVKSRLSFIIAVLKFSTDHTSASFLHPGRQPLPIIGTPMCIGQTKPTATGNTPKYQTIFLHNNSLSVTSQCV